MWFEALIVIACIVGLWLGGTWIIDTAARIARRIGMSELVIGLTVVAIGTSAPEFAVTVAAALNGQADISVGNVVGSNIFNLGFILGGVALLVGIPTTRKMVQRDGFMLVATSVLLLLFLLDLRLAPAEGVILLTVLLGYICYLVVRRDGGEFGEAVGDEPYRWRDIPLLLLGIALVITSGHYLVDAATAIARHFGLSEWVIGVTIVAAGTSAPELATSLMGVMRGKHSISVGNVIGSDLFNLLGVLGLAALISPLAIDGEALGSLLLLSGLAVVVVVMLRTGWRLSRLEGGLLVAINLMRWLADFA